MTFLAIVPAAIMSARFYRRNPYLALRMHVWLQILTVLFLTVVLTLGFFAVGPERSLTNPHHGIGVALYVLVFFQVLFGGWLHRRERGKRRLYLPLKLMLHQWLGRAIALLGIVQIALGLTLYGSPEWLFIVYTLVAVALLVIYFVLSWRHQKRSADYASEGSYVSETEVVDDRPGRRRRSSGLDRLAAVGAAGAGLAALWSRRRSKSQDRRHDQSVVGSDSYDSYLSDEKHDETRHGGLGHRLLQIGAIGGGVAAARKLFGRKGRTDDADLGPYRPPLGGNQAFTEESVSRLEEGRRPVTPTATGAVPANPTITPPRHPLAQPPLTPHHRSSVSSLSYDDYMSSSPSRRGDRHNFRNTLATAGAFAALRQMFNRRRDRKEDRRVDDMRQQNIAEERVARANSNGRYTGDGFMPRRQHARMDSEQSASSISESLLEDPYHRRRHGAVHDGISPAVPAGVGAAAASALSDRDRIRPVGTDPVVTSGPNTMPITDVPPVPPTHSSVRLDSSASDVDRRDNHGHRLRDEAAANMAGAALGAAAANQSRRRRSSTQNTDSMGSTPVSVKVKMHNDGRHVTLRRLTQDEAAAQREARRQSKDRDRVEARSSSGRRRRRNDSLSSSEAGNRRWRRTEERERQEAANMAAAATAHQPGPSSSTAVPPGYNLPPPPPGPPPMHHTSAYPPAPAAQQYNVPPPPPIPGPPVGGGGGGSGVTSPGTITGTEASGATEYANNRRRRRAERAQAKLAREARGGGGGVDYT
ncbi:MAG: hypothetical protein Q9160_007370 [Pyrenula sp. 1 TL-2023]